MRPEPVRLVIDLGVATPLRREVGPTAWVVLEALASSSPLAVGRVSIDSSVRDLARDAALSKDTIARALRRLFEARIVERLDGRDEGSGRFARSTYVVDLDAAGLSLQASSPVWSQPDTALGTSQSAGVAGAGGAQLSLLDDGR